MLRNIAANISHSLLQQTKIYCTIICLLLFAAPIFAQLTISGTVFDSSKIVPVKDVLVKSTSGNQTITDSTGHYDIVATDRDSITFTYLNKPTAKFAVKQIDNIGNFDISLHVRVAEKFRTMKEVKVYTKSFRKDSIENRLYYNKIFSYQKPGIATSITPGSGGVGLDLDEFINIFRFRRNKQLHRMQERLLEQEQENYVKYRFNKLTVKRITKLDGTNLDNFMAMYRPSFEFAQMATTTEFYQYILNASYQYKKELLIKSGK